MENEEIYILTKRTIPALRQEWEDTVYYAHEEDTEEESATEPDSAWLDGVEPGTTEIPTDSQEPVTQEPTSQEPTSQEPESQEPVIERVKVKKNDVNVRKQADVSSTSLGKADKGDIYEIKEKVEGSDGKIWVKIDYNGKTGYIRSDFLEEVTE